MDGYTRICGLAKRGTSAGHLMAGKFAAALGGFQWASGLGVGVSVLVKRNIRMSRVGACKQ